MIGELCDVKGKFSVKGDCEMEMFYVIGCIDVLGLLNVGDIKFGLSYDVSYVWEIGGIVIIVKSCVSFFNWKKVKLIVDVIEGDQVYLENIEVVVVRGKEVIIGLGCSIGIIEYKNICECDYYLNIKEKIKL